VFAQKYILSTVHLLRKGELNNTFENSTKYWGRAVLEHYFQHCEHVDEIEQAYQIFRHLSTPNTCPDWIPYQESQRPALTITCDQLYQLALRRRSVRHYLDKPVEAELIEQAMTIAALSPSACNRQSFKFLFFNDKAFVKQLSEIPGGIAGYEVPSIVVVVGSYRGYFNERDVNVPVIDAMLAAMAFLFALESLNLSSVCINWPSLREPERKIRKLIDLKDDEFVIMLIGVGYSSPEGRIPFSAKRPTSELLLINQRIK
jgi:nitroreductase